MSSLARMSALEVKIFFFLFASEVEHSLCQSTLRGQAVLGVATFQESFKNISNTYPKADRRFINIAHGAVHDIRLKKKTVGMLNVDDVNFFNIGRKMCFKHSSREFRREYYAHRIHTRVSRWL